MKKKESVLKFKRGDPLDEVAGLVVFSAKHQHPIKNSTVTLKYGDVEIEVSPRMKPEHVINAFFAKAASLPNMGIPKYTGK